MPKQTRIAREQDFFQETLGDYAPGETSRNILTAN